MTFDDARAFLASRAARSARVGSEAEWKAFKKASTASAWVYLLRWNSDRYCWGTCTNKSDRVRKASIFNTKLTGKYDRRVDYLMLKIIHGLSEAWVFEAADATAIESELKTRCSQLHCYRGIAGRDRDAISQAVITEFKTTAHYIALTRADQANFDEYLRDVFFAKKWIPTRDGTGKRTFHYGDSIEPNFLVKIAKKHLEPSIERVLKVKF